MSDETFKRWLAVLIAGVTLLVGTATFLENRASNRSSVLQRESQQAAIQATGVQTRGQERLTYDQYGVLTLTDELYSYAIRNQLQQNDPVGRAYLAARDQLVPLSPLLSPDYTQFDANGFRTETQFGKYEADTYLVKARLYDEQRDAYAQAGNDWDNVDNSYVAIIAILAVSLFLFALAGTLGGMMRWVFIGVGIVIGSVATLWMILTALLPVHQIPEAALEQVAQGSGYAAQAQDYYFVGQGIAGMPLPYDAKRVLEPTDLYKTNVAQYAEHTNEFWQKAIDAYSAALELDSTYANAYDLRGIARQKIQPAQSKAAEEDFKQAIALGANHYGVYWNLAIAQYYNGEFQDAVASSRTALRLNDGECGPSFTMALAILAQGELDEAQKTYDDSITRCDEIYRAATAQGDQPPVSLWTSMEGAADDLDDLLCALASKYCYPNRTFPRMPQLSNAQETTDRAESLRKRVKEALTKLEFEGTTTVTPTGAKFAPLTFGYYMINPDNVDEFLNYAARKTFPYNEFSPRIESFSSYTGMSKDYEVVWKVRRNGIEDPGLRYADKWNLEEQGPVVRDVNSWYVLLPGAYELEIYVEGELVQSGSFEISPQAQLTNTLPTKLKPAVDVPVDKLSFHETFDNNFVNWWTGSAKSQEEGSLDGGELTIVRHEPNSTFNSSCTDCITQPDFYLEADAHYVSGPEDQGYGLIYRGTVDFSTFYTFLITRSGYYYVGRYQDKWTPLVNWEASSAIKPDASNKLGIMCRGSHCDFYINGEHVNSADDDVLNGGFMGVRVDAPDLKAAFDNVNIWTVQ